MGKYWTRKGDQEDIDEKTINPFAELITKSDRAFPKRKPLKVALFDLDGTLFDTEPQYTIYWGSVGRKYNLGDDFADRIKGSTLTRILGYFPDPKDQEAVSRGIDEYEATMHYDFVPGALEFLRDLKANGVICAVVTSSNQNKMASVRRQMPEFDTLFDRVFTAEEFTRSKPAPDCYLLGLEVYGVEREECVVFEDAFNGLESAMAAGIFTVGLATYNKPEAIKDKCNYVINDFTDFNYEKLINILDEQN